MAYDVASSIKELLYDFETVIIPGFGGFVLEEKSANIDYIKSTISPPSKIVSFNKNLTLNDGVLINYLKEKNRCTVEQANQILEDFITETNEKIENKDIIEFPKVGRLYKDYDKKIQFLPYDTNFNTAVFGLPEIEAHPFSRNEDVKTKAAAASSVTVAETAAANIPSLETPTVQEQPVATSATAEYEADIPEGTSKKKKGLFGWTQSTLPFLALASIAIVLLSYFIFFRGDNDQDNSEGETNMAMNDGVKINEKPTDPNVIPLPEDGETEGESSPNDDSELFEEGAEMANDESENDEGVTEDDSNEDNSSAPATTTEESFGERECIVIVGQFSKKSNADRFARRVEKDGYDSYQGWNEEREWNTVGVKFMYETISEKEDMLEQLRYKYDESAWVLEE